MRHRDDPLVRVRAVRLQSAAVREHHPRRHPHDGRVRRARRAQGLQSPPGRVVARRQDRARRRRGAAAAKPRFHLANHDQFRGRPREARRHVADHRVAAADLRGVVGELRRRRHEPRRRRSLPAADETPRGAHAQQDLHRGTPVEDTADVRADDRLPRRSPRLQRAEAVRLFRRRRHVQERASGCARRAPRGRRAPQPRLADGEPRSDNGVTGLLPGGAGGVQSPDPVHRVLDPVGAGAASHVRTSRGRMRGLER